MDSDFDKIGGVVSWKTLSEEALRFAGKGVDEIKNLMDKAAREVGIGSSEPKAPPSSPPASTPQGSQQGGPTPQGSGGNDGGMPWDEGGSPNTTNSTPPSEGAESTQDPGPVAGTERIITIPGGAVATRKVEVDSASLDSAGTLA